MSLGPRTPPGSTTEAAESPRHDHGVSSAWAEDLSSRACFPNEAAPCSNLVHEHIRPKPSELDAFFDRAEQYCNTRCVDHEISARQRVAFRDKEIAHLEELMRTTHERLRCSEEASICKDRQLAGLQGRLSHCENRLIAYSDLLAVKRADLIEAQRACRSKDVALQSWASAYWNVQQSYIQDHMDQIVKTKNSEILMLRMLCESKDAIVTHQEQAIAQSVMLRGGMHDELERVSCELAALEINLANESKVSEEQGEVIAQLRASLKNALDPARLAQETASAPPVSDRACRITHSSLATFGTNASGDIQATPQPSQYVPLPIEYKRAALWRHGPRYVAFPSAQPGWQYSGDVHLDGSAQMHQEDVLGPQKHPQSQGASLFSAVAEPVRPEAASPPLSSRNHVLRAEFGSHSHAEWRPEPFARDEETCTGNMTYAKK